MISKRTLLWLPAILLAACGPKPPDDTDTGTVLVSIGGMAEGLAGSGLVLRNNGGDDLAVEADGAFTFDTRVALGAAYDVTVAAFPTGPSQTCVVTSGQGSADADVDDVRVSCEIDRFDLGGTVAGLAGGTLVLDNDGESLPIDTDGAFTFPTPLLDGTAYEVTLAGQPANPAQACTLSNATGVIDGGSVDDVVALCPTDQHDVGGNVSGLVGSGLVLANNGGDDLSIDADGGFTFDTPLYDGTSYSVTVATQPSDPGQTCAVGAGFGTVSGADVDDVEVTCTLDSWTVGGTVTGLEGDAVQLHNAGETVTATADGGFAFPTPQTYGDAYDVTVIQQPALPDQTCVVAMGTGLVPDGPVTDIAVTCRTHYTLGGTVTGLAGSGLVLQDGAQTLPISADGPFVFGNIVLDGASYTVIVETQPVSPSQTCSIAQGTGTVSGDVDDIAVTCVTDQFTVGGAVSGLNGSVTLTLGGEVLQIDEDGPFTFPPLDDGTAYDVTVSVQPTSPSQTCTVTGGTGALDGADVATVAVSCTTDQFTVGGGISGLSGEIVLQLNGGDDLSRTVNGPFTFATPLDDLSAYAVTVLEQPDGQECEVTSGTGNLAGAPVTDVVVDCVDVGIWSIGGTVVGLTGAGLVIGLEGESLPLTANGPFAFTTLVHDQAAWAIAMEDPPEDQACRILGGSGVAVADVTNVIVACERRNVIHLPFDEGSGTVAVDATGNGWDGDTTLAGWTAGVAGTATHVPTATSTVYTAWAQNAPPQWSMSAWIKDDKGWGSTRWVSSVNSGVSGRGLQVDSTDHLAWLSCLPADGMVARGMWTHVAVTWDGTLRYYVDGQPAGTVACSAFVSWNMLSVGNKFTGDTKGLYGALDDFRLDDVAWDDATALDRGSVLALHLEEGDYDIAADASGLHHHGRVAGTWTGNGTLSLDGISDAIVVDDADLLDLGERFALDISFARTRTGVDESLIAKGGWRLFVNGRDEVAFEVDGVEILSAFGAPVTDTAWHDAALVRSGEHLSLWLDDVLVAERIVGPEADIVADDQPVTIGAGFAGEVDDIRIRPSPGRDATLRSAWRFDEGMGTTGAESGGLRQDADVQGAGVGWGPGIAGSALALDDAWVATDTPASFGAPANWTVAAWIYDEGGPSVARGVLSVDTQQRGLTITGADHLAFYPCAEGDRQVPSGRWTQVGATWDGAQLRYWIDGQPAGTVTCTPHPAWQVARLGGHPSGVNLQGRIDEVRIYTEALSAAEMEALSTVLWLPMDASGGDFAWDRSPLLNHGTLLGASWITSPWGGGLHFAGGARVEIASSEALDLDEELTLEVAVRRDRSGVDETLVAKDDGAVPGGWRLHVDADDRLAFEVDGIDVLAGGLLDDQWHEVSVVRRGEVHVLRIDDVMVAEGLYEGLLLPSDVPVTLGADATGGAPLMGDLTAVRLRRVALPQTYLVGGWHLDGDAVDVGGRDLHGTLVADAAFGPGIVGQAIVLDGVDDRVETPWPLYTTAPDEWTLALWAKSDGPPNGQRLVMVRTDQGRGLALDGAGALQFWGCPPSTAVIPTERWTHLAARFDGTDITYFIDGVQAGAFTCSAYPAWNTFRIGTFTNDANGFAGSIDEVRLYDRTLSSFEIEALTAVVDLDLAEGVGTVAYDGSPYAHHGDITGATSVGDGLSFDGDDVVTVPLDASVDLTELGTVEVLVRRTRIGVEETLVARDDGSTAGRWRLYVRDDDAPAFDVDGVEVLHAPDALLDDTAWHDVGVVWQGDYVTLWVDGQQVEATLSGARAGATNLPLTLGEGFAGDLDDVRVRPLADPVSPLIARYRFDEGAGTLTADASGTRRDAVLVSETWGPGHAGTALVLDGGASAYATAPYPAALTMPAAWTVEAWVTHEARGGNQFVLITRDDKNRGMYITDTGHLQWTNCSPSTTAVQVGTWAHLAVRWDGADVTYTIDDGNQVVSETSACAPPDDWNAIRIGGRTSGSFVGTIDEVFIYDEARTDTEVANDRGGS